MITKNGRSRSPRGTAKSKPAETAARLTGHAKTQATLTWIDSVPYYVSQLALRLPRLQGTILMHLWHVTAGNHRPNAVVPHSALEALLGTKRYEPALADLETWGMIKRRKVAHKGHSTWCYAVETNYTQWQVPAEYTAALDTIVEQGIWKADSIEDSELRTDAVAWGSFDKTIKSALQPQDDDAATPETEEELRWDVGIRGATQAKSEGTADGSDGVQEAGFSPLPGRGKEGDASPYPDGGLPPTGTGDAPLRARGKEGQQTQQAEGLTGSPNVHCSNRQSNQQGALAPPPVDCESIEEKAPPKPSLEGRALGGGKTAMDTPMPPPDGGADGQTAKKQDPAGSRPCGARDLEGVCAAQIGDDEIFAARMRLWLTNARAWYEESRDEKLRILNDFGKRVCRAHGLDWHSIVSWINDADNPPFLYKPGDFSMGIAYGRIYESFDTKLRRADEIVQRIFEADMDRRYRELGLTPPRLPSTQPRFRGEL